MDEITRNVPKTFDRVSRKLVYFFVLTALVATAAVGYTFLPEAEVSAQERDTKPGVEADAPEVATRAMIDFSIGALSSASEYTVYAERGINDKGGSTVRGTQGRRVTQCGRPEVDKSVVELDRRNETAAMHGDEELGPFGQEL